MATMMRRLSSSLRLLQSKMAGTEDCNVLLVGLDNSGKSTFIKYLRKDKEAGTEAVAPTVGFKVETFRRGNLCFTAFDMSGQGKYRNLWEKHYGQVHGIIFVVDSTDKMRMCVAKDELETLLEHPALQAESIPLLFLANKMDDPSRMPASQIVSQLDLASIRERPWCIVETNACTGEGVEEAMDWLSDNVVSKSVEEKARHK